MGGAGAERIGLLGGSFDPPHEGHLWMARRARRWLDLDAVRFLPAFSPPHKDPAGLAPYADRVAMLELLLDGEAGLSLSHLERDSGCRYSVDLMRHLARERGGLDGCYFIIGEDSLADMSGWREPAALFELVRVLVLAREGARPRIQLPCLVLTGEMHPAQSRLVRAALQRGEEAHWLTAAVSDYIARQGLYRAEGSP